MFVGPVRALERRCVAYRTVFDSGLRETLGISWRADDPECRGYFSIRGETLSFEEITGVLLRTRWQNMNPRNSYTDAETQAFLQGLFSAMRCRVANRPEPSHCLLPVNDHGGVLAAIGSSGFDLPPTLTTADHDCMRQFHDDHGRQVLCCLPGLPLREAVPVRPVLGGSGPGLLAAIRPERRVPHGRPPRFLAAGLRGGGEVCPMSLPAEFDDPGSRAAASHRPAPSEQALDRHRRLASKSGIDLYEMVSVVGEDGRESCFWFDNYPSFDPGDAPFRERVAEALATLLEGDIEESP